jgi:hypothetical protein
MKKLLLKLAYCILNRYKQNPRNIDLGEDIFVLGGRFRILRYTVNKVVDGVAELEIQAVEVSELSEVLYGRN